MKYKQVQQIAKQTIDYIKSEIEPGMTLPVVRQKCEQKMLVLGADSFWYWDVGAFVFAGDETTISVSGREYKTSERVIQENDIRRSFRRLLTLLLSHISVWEALCMVTKKRIFITLRMAD